MPSRYCMQLPLLFDEQADYTQENFLVTSVNEDAYRWVLSWPSGWPSQAMVLQGAKGAGKTHLAHVWASISGAGWMDAQRFHEQEPDSHFAEHRCWVLDDVAAYTVNREDEVRLFHWLNRLVERSCFALFTSVATVAELGIGLPDLRSRLLMLPYVTIQPPDDMMMEVMLVKQFSDRQLRVPAKVVSYLLSRMERSFASIQLLVRRLDRLSLARHQPVTVAMARELLGEQAEDGVFIPSPVSSA